MRIYIYKIWFPTSEKYYIGLTNNLRKRLLYGHLITKSFVGRALRKYDNWQISILHIIINRNLALLLEIMEIWNHNSITPNGYNLTRGGEGGITYGMKNKHHTKETKEKMRRAHIGIHRKINGIPALQKQYDEQYNKLIKRGI